MNGGNGGNGKRKEVQLYELIHSLSSIITNSYIAGSVIGYSIINALKDYSPSKECEFKKEEMQRIYSSLSEIIENSKVTSEHKILSNLQSGLNDFLQDLRKGTIHSSSAILEGFSKKLQTSEGTPQEIVSKKGLNIMMNANLRGISRSQNYIFDDYDFVKQYFLK